MIETLTLVLTAALLLGGVTFTLISAIGLLRLPDVYSRSHLATETDTLGAGLALAAVALALGWDPSSIRIILLVAFIFVANPTAAHAIARAAYEDGVKTQEELGNTDQEAKR